MYAVVQVVQDAKYENTSVRMECMRVDDTVFQTVRSVAQLARVATLKEANFLALAHSNLLVVSVRPWNLHQVPLCLLCKSDDVSRE